LTSNADAWEKWSVSTIDGNEGCHFQSTSLFCFTVMRSWGFGLGVLQKQIELGAGIFGCEDFLVLSDKEVQLSSTPQVRTTLITDESMSNRRGMYKNSGLFLNIWKKVKVDGRYKAADWIIKSDPDTVFLPDRLRMRVGGKTHANHRATFYANCAAKVDVQSAEHPHFMYGPLEVFSNAAVVAYFGSGDRCEKEVGLGDAMWEERYMTHCLELLDVKMNTHLSLNLLSDPHCDNIEVSSDCSSGAVAFHNFGTSESYQQCWSNAHAGAVDASSMLVEKK